MVFRYTSALVTLSAQNFDELMQFYCQFLQQDPVAVIPNVYAEFELPGVRLGIFKPKGSGGVGEWESGGDREDGNEHPRQPAPDPRHPAPMSLCLEVEQLEAAIAHLTELGCSLVGEITIASHGREIHAVDPEGNGLILHQATRRLE